MGANHDILAEKSGRAIVSKIVRREGNWGQIFSDNINKAGDFGWPKPDYVCYDFTLEHSLAFEFKPPGQSKREYLTGLGQSIAYLSKHHYSGIILPQITEGYKIAEHLVDILSLDVFAKKHIAVIGYDERTLEYNPTESIKLLKPIEDLRDGVLIINDLGQTYWCWWRDASHYEILQLLILLDKYSSLPGDIYTQYVWPEFWKMMISRQTKTWEGMERNKTDTKASFNSEKQNYKIPLFHLGLIEPSEGRLTIEGYRLLSIGKMFGPDSSLFMDYLTKLVLIEGKHLILIRDLEEFKDIAIPQDFENQTAFRQSFEEYLRLNNSIGPGKPGRKTTGNKESYIRDEFKLWNKLNLLKSGGKQYFVKGRGLEFNWSRITDILTNDFRI